MDIKSLRKILLKKGFLLSKKSVVTKQTSLQNLYKISLLSLIIILFFYFLPSSVKFTQKILKPNLEIYTPDNTKELIKLIKKKTIEKDLILIMGAGDINMVSANLFLELINNKSIRSDLAA